MGQVVAIDGPAGAGKSTVARAVAEKLNYLYIDTGAMYRALALWAIRQSIDFGDAHRLGQLARSAEIELLPERHVSLNGEDVSEAIRSPEVAAGASRVAAVPQVRAEMVAKQKRYGEKTNVVMEGRDIGTVVFPGARVKIFLDAAPTERVRRRAGEQPGVPAEELAREIAERDERDRNREQSPLIQAPDAVYIDSTGLSAEQVEEKILRIVRTRISNGKEK